MSSVASENWVRRGGGRWLWRPHCQGRQQSLIQFSPQPAGTGPVLPISSSLVASVTGYSALLAPRTEQNWLPSLPSHVVLTGPSWLFSIAVGGEPGCGEIELRFLRGLHL